MPAFTPTLNLYKPGGGSTGLITPDEVADIDRLNANSDLIDAWAAKVGDPTSNRRTAYYGTAAAMGGALTPPPKDGDTYQESDGNKILWRRMGGLWVTNENGAYLIRPTSVVNGSVAPDGAVTAVGGQATLSMNGCFSSRFRAFELIWFLRFNISSGFAFRFRAAGTDYSATNYLTRRIYTNGAGAITSANLTADKLDLATIAADAHHGRLLLLHPAGTTNEQGKSYEGQAGGAGGTNYNTTIVGNVNSVDTTAFDGFTAINTSAGTINATSWMKIYGLV